MNKFSKQHLRLPEVRERRLADVFALTSFGKSSRSQNFQSFPNPSSLAHHFSISKRPHNDAMDTEAAETKVQIRLTTRDSSLQISEEPSTLLVQTCKYRRGT